MNALRFSSLICLRSSNLFFHSNEFEIHYFESFTFCITKLHRTIGFLILRLLLVLHRLNSKDNSKKFCALFSQKFQGGVEIIYNSSCIFLDKYKYSGKRRTDYLKSSELITTCLSSSPRCHIPVCKAGILRGLLYQNFFTLVKGVGHWFEIGLQCDLQCLNAVGPRFLPESIPILTLSSMPGSSQYNY